MLNYIDLLQLKAQKAGGYFAIFYKSSDKVLAHNDQHTKTKSWDFFSEQKHIERHAGSSIYFLLHKEDFSAWHRLKSDEIWHYYDGGSPIDIHIIDHDGQLKTFTLGHPGLTENASFQVIIKAGVWFAAEVRDKKSFGLVGCTVSPAFEYNDFELAEAYRNELVNSYPELRSIIDKFIKPQVTHISERIHNNVSSTKNKLSANDYIQKLKLEKHQEGGFFCLNYKATDIVLPLESRYKNKDSKKDILDETPRNAGSSIYFLLHKEDFSAWHRLKSDEIWHYYDGGSPIDIHIIDHDGQLKTFTLGHPGLTENASFQVIIKAGVWFAAEVSDKKSFGLVGCTVSPAFEYNDFELANRENLASQYPLHESIINRLTRIPSQSLTNKAISYVNLALMTGIGFYSFVKENETINSCLSNLKAKIGI